MTAKIYEVWEHRDGQRMFITRDERERIDEQRRRNRYRPMREGPRLVDSFIACNDREARAFLRRLETANRQN